MEFELPKELKMFREYMGASHRKTWLCLLCKRDGFVISGFTDGPRTREVKEWIFG